MPNGYSDIMGIFTKILKPSFSKLRPQGYLFVKFSGDFYLEGKFKSKCLQNVHDTGKLLEALGFTIHKSKSVLEPTQTIEFVSFVIFSVKITVSLNPAKPNIRVKADNTITIAYISNIGGNVSLRCNVLLQEIWEHCIEKTGLVSAEHIPRHKKSTADFMSSVLN